MFKKTLTAAVAALALSGALVTSSTAAEARDFNRGAVGAAIVGTVIGLIAGSASARPTYAQPAYAPGYGPVRYDGCGVQIRPIFDEYGRQVGVRKVPMC